MFVTRAWKRWRNLPKSKRRRRTIALVFLLGFGALQLRSSEETPVIPPPTIALVDVIDMEVPEEVAAGQSFVIEMAGLDPGTDVEIQLEAGYGLTSSTVVPDDEELSIEVQPIDGPGSGQVLITVVQGAATAKGTIEVVPGVPVDPIDVYLGPRTVVADGAHFVMLVAIPEDEFGNPIAQGSRVDFTTTRPNQLVEQEFDETEDLVAWYEVFSRTVTGRTRIATQAGEATAPERDFLEVADIPVPFEVQLVDPMLPADGQALLTFQTDILRDRFGNIMPDGIVAYLDAEGVSGNRRIHSQAIDGRAEFTLEVPDRPGEVTLTAIVSGTRSEPLVLDFASVIQSMAGEVERNELVTMVHVGPIVTTRGSFVPEGVVAHVTLADGLTGTADLSNGEGTAFFPAEADTSRVVIEVLGSEIVLEEN